MIQVWEPRYHDRKVLVAAHKVRKGMNIIKIKHPNKIGAYDGRYRMSAIAIKSYPLESNGVINCYALPIDKLERI